MLLMVNVEFWPLVLKLVKSICGIIAIAGAFAVYLLTRVQIYERILLSIVAISMIFGNSSIFNIFITSMVQSKEN